MRDLFARSFIYEDRASDAIREAKQKWSHIEEILAAMEWGLAHDPALGPLLNERGIRGFVYPGARYSSEPDIDVLYEDQESTIIVHDLRFSDAKAYQAGRA